MLRYSIHIRRLKDIVIVFLKYGFYPLIKRIHLHRVISLLYILRFKKGVKEGERLSYPERLRLAFEELGPTFIKLGQLLSSRPDILSDEYIDELTKLLDEVPPEDFADIKNVIERELNAPIRDVFYSFEETPVAAASIAQVHLATLYDGREVAVKVQRPGIRDIIRDDIGIFYYIANLMERHYPESRIFNPKGVIDEFSRVVNREMDFLFEASSMERMAKELRTEKGVLVPPVIREFTTRRVLTMGRLKGIRIDDVDGLVEQGIDPGEIARRVATLYLKQVFVTGFFHGDPHPGNIFVSNDGTIGLCDFGIMGSLDDRLREALANLLVAVVNMDYESIVKIHVDIGVVGEDVDIMELREDIRDLLVPYHGRSLREINPVEVFAGIVRVGIKNNVRLPRSLMLLDRTLLILDSLLRRLDPEFVLLDIAEPFAMEIIKKQKGPERILKDIADETYAIQGYIRDYPSQIHRLFKKMLDDKFTVDFMHKGLDHLIGEMDRSSNRLTFGIIVAALIVGSSFIMLVGEGPKVFGLSLLGVVGFGIGSLLGFILVILILRSGKY